MMDDGCRVSFELEGKPIEKYIAMPNDYRLDLWSRVVSCT